MCKLTPLFVAVGFSVVAVGFSRRQEGPPALIGGFSPLFFAGAKVPQQKGGRFALPSAEADGNLRSYFTGLSY